MYVYERWKLKTTEDDMNVLRETLYRMNQACTLLSRRSYSGVSFQSYIDDIEKYPVDEIHMKDIRRKVVTARKVSLHRPSVFSDYGAILLSKKEFQVVDTGRVVIHTIHRRRTISVSGQDCLPKTKYGGRLINQSGKFYVDIPRSQRPAHQYTPRIGLVSTSGYIPLQYHPMGGTGMVQNSFDIGTNWHQLESQCCENGKRNR